MTVILAVLAFGLIRGESAESGTVSLKLKSGQLVNGSVVYIDARGIGLKTEKNPLRKLTLSNLDAASVKRHGDWLSGEAKVEVDRELTLKTQKGTLAYDLSLLEAEKGELVRAVLINEDDLPHNLVFSSSVNENAGQEIASAALDLGGEGMTRQWIPDSNQILAASSMVDPQKKASLYFRVPASDGDYPYVCTFPGHSLVMKGVLRVGNAPAPEDDGDFRLGGLSYKLFNGSFDAIPDFDSMTPSKSEKIQGSRMNIKKLGVNENFGVVFEGTLNLPADGEYAFGLDSDDGSRLIIDGKTIINYDKVHGMGNVKRAKAELAGGAHKLRVEFFERNGQEGLYAEVKSPQGKTLILTPGKAPKSDNSVGIPLYPLAGEAMIYRNFIQGVGTARGIGVGFSEGIHFAYDAQNGRLPMIWKGGFMDAKRHWTGRGQGFQPPSGSPINLDPLGAIIADLSDIKAEWPENDWVALGKVSTYSGNNSNPSQFRFHGYTLNKKRHPIFSWSWNGLQVTDYTRPVDGGIMRRTLTFKGKPKVKGMPVLRVGAGNPDQVTVQIPKKFKAAMVGEEYRIPIPTPKANQSFRVTIQYKVK